MSGSTSMDFVLWNQIERRTGNRVRASSTNRYGKGRHREVVAERWARVCIRGQRSYPFCDLRQTGMVSCAKCIPHIRALKGQYPPQCLTCHITFKKAFKK